MPKKTSDKSRATIALKNQELVLNILHNEIVGDWQNALKKMHPSYSMTWVNKSLGELFRTVRRDKNFNNLIKNAYKIRGRTYDIKNVVASNTCVMVELVESYPDVTTAKIFRTPLVLVLEFSEGKIIRGRHYYDPSVPNMFLSKKQVDKIYQN